MVDSDSNNKGVIDSTSTRDGDPKGGHTDRTVNNEFSNAPSMSVKDMDHQEVHRTSPGTTEHPSVPQPLCHSAHLNKGIPPMHPDEDPKLAQGSRPSAKRMLTPAIQDPVGISVGMDEDGTQNAEPLLNIVDDDISTLYLTTDAQSYKEAMRHNDTNDWVVVVMEEYQNLHQKGIFVEVEVPLDMHIHEGHLVFTEKVRSEGGVTKKKARLVVKGYTEVWGEDYWHTYSPTLGHDTLFSCLTYAASRDLEIHQLVQWQHTSTVISLKRSS